MYQRSVPFRPPADPGNDFRWPPNLRFPDVDVSAPPRGCQGLAQVLCSGRVADMGCRVPGRRSRLSLQVCPRDQTPGSLAPVCTQALGSAPCGRGVARRMRIRGDRADQRARLMFVEAPARQGADEPAWVSCKRRAICAARGAWRRSRRHRAATDATGHDLALRLGDVKTETPRLLHDARVPFPHRHAERDLCMMKLRIKISGSSPSERGAKDFATLCSVLPTGRKQGRNRIETLMRGPAVLLNGRRC